MKSRIECGVRARSRPISALQSSAFQARSLSLQGWGLIDLPLRATFSPAHPLADIFHPPYPPIASQSISLDVPVARARAFQSSSSLVKGVAKVALYCAHRTSTDSPCAFCEQEGHLAAPYALLPSLLVLSPFRALIAQSFAGGVDLGAKPPAAGSLHRAGCEAGWAGRRQDPHGSSVRTVSETPSILFFFHPPTCEQHLPPLR